MILGITGGVGCGKSTVLEILKKDYGAKVLIADNMGHEVMKKGGEAYPAVIDAFGTEVVGDDGDLNRAALAELIYTDDTKREQLNGIIHPCVKEEIKRKLKEWEREPFIVLETALLFETGCDSMCDCIWGIEAEREVRIQRLMQSRGYTREKAEGIMKKQLSENEFRSRCDKVIENSGTTEQLRERLAHLLLGMTKKI